MISLLIKSYLTLLVSVGAGSLLLFVLGLYFIFKRPRASVAAVVEIKADAFLADHDLSAIAGDDVFATQLDLALAYIETGKKQSAKNILDAILKQGSAPQQAEAQRLLSYL